MKISANRSKNFEFRPQSVLWDKKLSASYILKRRVVGVAIKRENGIQSLNPGFPGLTVIYFWLMLRRFPFFFYQIFVRFKKTARNGKGMY